MLKVLFHKLWRLISAIKKEEKKAGQVNFHRIVSKFRLSEQVEILKSEWGKN